MNGRRTYTSAVRAERAAGTRARILAAAQDLFVDATRTLTLDQVASTAGVSVQTVLRAYGSREGLILAAIGTLRDAEVPTRVDPFPTVEEAVGSLFDDYERIGDRVVRMLADEHRIPGFAEVAAHGRDMHRRWVEAAFEDRIGLRAGRARTTVVTALVAATDVYVWQLLRRDLHLSRPAAEEVVVRLVEGALGPGRRE